jgi:hypothetical protein
MAGLQRCDSPTWRGKSEVWRCSTWTECGGGDADSPKENWQWCKLWATGTNGDWMTCGKRWTAWEEWQRHRAMVLLEWGFYTHGKRRLPFCYIHFFQFSTDFELIQRFWFKFELLEIFSLRLIVTTMANPPYLKLGQGVLHGDLQILHSHLVDMQKLISQIQEVMEFQRWLLIKQILEKSPSLGFCAWIALFGPLKQILFWPQ